ncbi:hypothetical protein N0V95_005601 [Ascochyta clinopodiicola]|nr:hypothetical protein N0V95_005601 [Ascochyta clinopodiicola]
MSDAPPAAPASSEAPQGEGPSKNALKKAQKEKEKAEKKAAAKARELADRTKKETADAEDVSKDSYGELPLTGSKEFKPTGIARVSLDDVADNVDKEITFRCWVENARVQSAKLAFLNLRQNLSTIQAVIAASDKLSKQMVKFCGTVSTESTIVVTGLVKKAPEPIKSASIQDFEIHIKKLFIEVKAEVPLPLQVDDAERPLPAETAAEEEQKEEGGERPLVSLNTRLNNRTLDLRAKINQSIFVVKSGVCAIFQEFLSKKGFTLVQTPKILGAASEGGANVFELKYFDRQAYLAQSPQFYKQMLIASRFQKVMEIGPVFRAENSNTARHLTEFTGLDLEMEFQEHYHEVMGVLEDLMLFIFKELNVRYKRETDLIRGVYHVDDFKLPESGNVPRIPFTEGIKMLRDAGEELGDYDDLTTPQEKHLGRLVLEKYNSDFYVLDQFPLAIRPAYTMPSPHDPKLSNSYDMFMRGQEICSGAQRIHNSELLSKQMREHDPPIDPNGAGTKDYVDCFRYGCPPHAGGGFGLERIVQFWLGLPNIRMCSLFPRDPQRVAPQWYDVAIRPLYASPFLAGRAYDLFVRTICPSVLAHIKPTSLSSLIRVLDLSHIIHQGTKSTTARLLGRTKVGLQIFIAPQASFAINCWASLSKCEKLKVLDLSLVSECISFQSLAQTLRRLGQLEAIYLPRCTSNYEGLALSMNVRWPPKLKHLSLSGSIYGKFLWDLLRQPDHFPPSLHSLSILHSPGLDHLGIRPLLQNLEASLTTVELRDLPNVKHGRLNSVLEWLPHLTTLTIALDYIDCRFGHMPMDWDPSMWESCVPLQSLTLVTSGQTSIDPARCFTAVDLYTLIDERFLGRLRWLNIAQSAEWENEQEGAEVGALEMLLCDDLDRENWEKRRWHYAGLGLGEGAKYEDWLRTPQGRRMAPRLRMLKDR